MKRQTKLAEMGARKAHSDEVLEQMLMVELGWRPSEIFTEDELSAIGDESLVTRRKLIGAAPKPASRMIQEVA
jgi:hypothetical protein